MPKGVYKHHPHQGFKKGIALRSFLGRKHSDEAKSKISAKKKGYKHSEEWKKRMSKIQKEIGNHPPVTRYWLGKNRSEETKKKLSESLRGSKSSLWKGGVSKANQIIRSSLEYRLWRSAVFQRDQRKCIWCGSSENIQADHIKPFAFFPELRFAIDNGRTLCKKCHETTDTYLKNKL